MLRSLLAIVVGASIGAVCRWRLGFWLNTNHSSIPLGTLAANLAGGYLIGVCMVFFTAHPTLAPEWRLLIVTGFLGALTTFSTFSAEVMNLIQQGRLLGAVGAISVHVLGSLLMTFLGMMTCSWLQK